MANLCEKLLAGCIGADCDNPIFAGMESKAWIFNKSEIASFTYDSQNPNVITDIVMKEISQGVNAVGYTISQLGKTPFTGTNTALVEGNAANKFTETFNFIVPDNSPAAAMLLDNIANGKFVVVAKNEYTGSDSKGAFQVYGAKKGLVATAMERDPYGEDADGGWAVTLTSENTPNSALFFYKTDAATTESTLDSLVDCGD
jgi:hypothetical protein